MSNIADMIEGYILTRLSKADSMHVELKRADIAEAIECAPSQISYVLSTRFTQSKGFVVESRRGLKGFIKIHKVPLKNYFFYNVLNEINNDITIEEVENLISYLYKNKAINKREMAVIMQCIHIVFENLEHEERANYLRRLIITLTNYHEE